MRTFSVKNYERFQHYKDRAPPWIKLYNELLDDYDFGLLPDASKMHLIAIWLLASRSENKIPYDPTWVARRINANSEVDLALLAASGFIVLDQELQGVEQDASTMLAKCLSREEGETEERQMPVASATPSKVLPIDPQARYFDRAVEILGPSGRGFAAKLLKAKGGVVSLALSALELADGKSDAREYIGAIIRGRDNPGDDKSRGRAW